MTNHFSFFGQNWHCPLLVLSLLLTTKWLRRMQTPPHPWYHPRSPYLLYTWTIIGWGAFTTVHIINCLPQTTTHNKSLIELLHDRVWNYSYFLVCLFCYTSHENLSLNLAFVVFLVIVSLKKNIVVRTHQTLSSVSHFFQSPSSLPPYSLILLFPFTHKFVSKLAVDNSLTVVPPSGSFNLNLAPLQLFEPSLDLDLQGSLR